MTDAYTSLMAATLAASNFDSVRTGPSFCFNVRTPEEWRQLDALRAAKRERRKARRKQVAR